MRRDAGKPKEGPHFIVPGVPVIAESDAFDKETGEREVLGSSQMSDNLHDSERKQHTSTPGPWDFLELTCLRFPYYL